MWVIDSINERGFFRRHDKIEMPLALYEENQPYFARARKTRGFD
jgi:hypothetical protein